MGDFLSNLSSNLLLIVVLFCVVPSLLLAIAAFFVWKRLEHFATPDVSEMQQQFAELRAARPTATDEELIRKVINRQARKCGIVGAVTSLGGFFTLPIALPADILISLRIQAAMVEFIAEQYGQHDISEAEVRMRTALVVAGGRGVTERTTAYLMRFMLRYMGKTFAKLVPFVGAIIGFVVNYAIALATANAAIRWYSRGPRQV